MRSSRIGRIAAATVVAVAMASGAVLIASHSWGNYHWARTTTSFNLTVVNSTTTDWDPYVERAVGYVTPAGNDWTASVAINMIQDLNGSTSDKDRRQCSAPSGALRICNLAYGFNGWLGIAGISIDTTGHIVSGYTKLNDSYFSTATYDTPAWRQSVTCQELGHNIGLDHQDEDFNNASLYSCMDYQNPPFEYPNDHDYEQLETIYRHIDSYNSYTGSSGGGANPCSAPPGRGCNKTDLPENPPGNAWGISLGRRGQQEKFLRVDADGIRHVTFVTWAEGH